MTEPNVPIEDLLHARSTDPQTSHDAMAEVPPGKIGDFARACGLMLRHEATVRSTDHHIIDGRPGLTDWEMGELFIDTKNPRLSYLDPYRQRYPETGENNVGGFIRMGRLWLARNGWVMDIGTRVNDYSSVTHGPRKARTGRIWHLLTVRSVVKVPKPKSRRALEAEIEDLRAELARLKARYEPGSLVFVLEEAPELQKPPGAPGAPSQAVRTLPSPPTAGETLQQPTGSPQDVVDQLALTI